METLTKKTTRQRKAVRKNFGRGKGERSRPKGASKTSRELVSASALRTAVEDAVGTRQELAVELADMVRLHQLSTRLFGSTALQPLLEEILDATMALLNADFGNVQLYNPQTKALEIVAHRGFRREFLDYFNNVHEGTASCGTAWKRRERVIVEDVLTEPSFAPHLKIVAAAGYRAVQSTPLFSRSGEPLGIISTHFRKPHRPSERQLRFVDLYAQQAAEMIERKRAEETLRESQHKFSVVFDKASFAIALAKLPEGIIVDVNPAFVEMFGFTKEQALGKTSVELGINRDLERRPYLFSDVLDQGYVRNLEATFFNKSGNPRLIACNIEVVSLGGEKYLLSTMRDVTEHKKAEADLRRSEAYLAEGQRLSHTASWAWNVSTGEIFWSHELFRIYGLDPKKVKPGYPDILNYIHPDDRAGVQKTFEETVREQREYELAYRVVRTDGTIRHVNNIAHPVFDRGGTLVEYVGTTIDATERIHAEEKLRRSEANLADGQRLSHTGSWAWNVATGECYWSLEHFRIFGLDPERFNPTKESTQRMIHPEDLPLVVQTLERAVRDRSDFEVEYRLVRPDGSIRYHRGLGHPVVKEGGQLEFIGTVMDVTKRKQAEEDLRRSEAFLAEGQRISHTGSWAVKFPSEDVSWSQEMFRIYDLDPATTRLSQQMAFELIHPEDRASVLEAFELAVREKSDYTIEHRAILPDGSLKHLHALGHPVVDKAGTLTEYVGTVVDVTERIEAEEALRKAHKQVDLILESISDQFFGLSKDWRFTYFNQHAAAQMKRLGKDPEELIGKVLWEEFPDVPNEANLRRVMSERVPITDQLYYPPMGEWVENHMYPSHDGGLVAFQRYITGRKQAEEEHRKLVALVENSQDFIGLASLEGNVLYVNDAGRKIVGLKGEGGTSIFDYAMEEDRAFIAEEMLPQIAKEGEWEGEMPMRHFQTGKPIPMHVNAFVIKEEGTGRPLALATISRDITERKDAEQKLHQTQAELARVTRLSTLGEIGASIAHEINQPLGAIVNNSNVCLKLIGRRGCEGKKREVLVDIANDALRASAIITRIRALTKRSTSEKTSFSVEELVAEVLALAHQTAHKASVRIKNLVPARLHLRADRVQLQQMLLNLVMNGIQAMGAVDKKKRTMTLQAKPQRLDGKAMITISVEDCGPGFTTEGAARLFEPFFTTKSEGMGLGLAISRSIAEAHGGRLWAKLNTCPGATFYCALPANGAKKSPARKAVKS